MNSIDSKTLVHVGVEFVVIGGVTFWLNKRISGIQEEVLELRKKVESYENVIQQQSRLINRHEEMLSQIFNPNHQKSTRPPPTKHNTSNNRPQQQSQIIEEDEDSEDEIPPEELDKLIGSELSSIKQKRTPNDEESEMECIGDECQLKDKSSRKKERSTKEHGE